MNLYLYGQNLLLHQTELPLFPTTLLQPYYTLLTSAARVKSTVTYYHQISMKYISLLYVGITCILSDKYTN